MSDGKSFFSTLKGKRLSQERNSAYSREIAKQNLITFELERTKDSLIKLKSELTEKNKEISLLKVKNIKSEKELQKTMRTLGEILKQCDRSTIQSFQIINKKSDSKTELPPLKDMIHLNENQQNQMEKMRYVDSLEKKIQMQKEELANKDNELNQLKKEQKIHLFTKLENNYVKNYNELTNLRRQNEEIIGRFEELNMRFESVRQEKMEIERRFENFKQDYSEYKIKSDKSRYEYENKIKKAEDKEKNCRIFHIKRSIACRNNSPNSENVKDADPLSQAEKEMKNLQKEISDLERTIQ